MPSEKPTIIAQDTWTTNLGNSTKMSYAVDKGRVVITGEGNSLSEAIDGEGEEAVNQALEKVRANLTSRGWKRA